MINKRELSGAREGREMMGRGRGWEGEEGEGELRKRKGRGYDVIG